MVIKLNEKSAAKIIKLRLVFAMLGKVLYADNFSHCNTEDYYDMSEKEVILNLIIHTQPQPQPQHIA